MSPRGRNLEFDRFQQADRLLVCVVGALSLSLSLHFLCQSSSTGSRLQFPSFKGSDRNPYHQRPPKSSVDNVKVSMSLGLRADDCNDLPSMENWLNAGADWTEHHGISIAATASAEELFYDQVPHPESTSSLFEPPTRQQALTTHPFLKLDTLELCKESIPLVRTGSSSMVDSSNNEDDLSTEHVANSTVVSVSTSLLDRSPAEVNLDSPRGPLSPSALQLGKSPTGTKRPFDDLATQAYSPFPAAMANSSFLPPGAANVVAPQGIIFPTPLTLPNVPSMEEIAQSRPKRRNVKISTDPQSVAARHRRERISDRVRVLQHFVPGGTKMDTASMLDEAIHYVKFLQQQLQAFERIGNGYDPRFLTQGGPVMMPQVNNSSSSPARPFDLNCAVYQAFPCTSMMQSQQQPQNVTTWPTFCSQGFPDSSQEQFCH